MIHSNGNATICSLLEGYSFGNVRQLSICDIWRGEKGKALLERLKRDLFPICANSAGSLIITPCCNC